MTLTDLDAWPLIKQVRERSSWTHPARRGLGKIITRATHCTTTPEDMQALEDMLKAVSK